MIEEPNGNNSVNVKLTSSSVIPIASSTSNDDLSQSLSVSEYTDADESMSAPTEYLAEVIILRSRIYWQPIFSHYTIDIKIKVLFLFAISDYQTKSQRKKTKLDI